MVDANQNVVVQNDRASIVEFSTPSHKLVPGENDVPKNVIDENLKNKNGVVRSWFDKETGFLRIKRGVKKARHMQYDLSKVSDLRAKEIIENTDSREILVRWSKTESRPELKKAISDRLQKLSEPEESETGPNKEG